MAQARPIRAAAAAAAVRTHSQPAAAALAVVVRRGTLNQLSKARHLPIPIPLGQVLGVDLRGQAGGRWRWRSGLDYR